MWMMAISGVQKQPSHSAHRPRADTVRTASWRFTEWRPFDAATGTANWSHTVGEELYAHNASAGPSRTTTILGECLKLPPRLE